MVAALKSNDAPTVRKLLLAAQRRAVDPTFVSSSSPGQRSKHSAVQLCGELEKLAGKKTDGTVRP